MGIGEIDGTVVELYDAALESTLTHEVGHAIRVDSPKLYAELRNFVRTRLYREGGFENLVDMRRKQYADTLGREISYEYAEEEVICNSLGDIITSERVMNEIAGKHRNLFGKIWHAIKEFFAKILRKMRGMDGDFAAKTPEQRIVERALLTKRRRLEDLFVKALKDASATSRASLALTDSEKFKNVTNPIEKAEKKTLTDTNGENMHDTGDNDEEAPATTNTDERYALPEALKSLGEYDATRIRHIESSRKDRVVRDYNEIKDFIKRSKSNPPFERLHIGIISDKTAALVKARTGEDITGYDFVLASNFVFHIYDSHGNEATEAPRGQKAVDDANIENIIEAVIAPDDVSLVSDSTGTALRFEKFLEGRNVAITITSTKKSTLTLKSAWIINEKSGGRTPSANANALAGTPEANSRSSTDNSITENAKKSNPSDEKSLSEVLKGKFSLRDKLEREALSEAFYGMAESEAEREIVSKYRAEIDDIDDKIDERRRVIQRLEEIEGKSGFGGERARLEGKLKGLNAYITGRDTRLFELESAKPFRDMVERYETELGKKRQSRAKAMGDGQYMYVSRGRYNELMARDPAS